nr:DUF6544 family protein [uncultured Mucilaginibacter sp.]
MIVLIIILAGLLMLAFAAKVRAGLQFTKQVNKLFALSPALPKKVFRYEQLNGLPAPVQRYFKHVLKEGQPYINYVRLKHSGKFKPGADKKWVNIVGEEYFTTAKPGFLWKGETAMFTATDRFMDGSGGLKVNIFNTYPMVNGKGSKFDQGELLRWLGECVWFPTSLLPGEDLRWTAIDNKQAKLTFRYGGLEVHYIVMFDDNNEIIQLQTMRYMGDGCLETWVAKLKNYRKINGVMIPFDIEAAWELKQGTLSYADFHLEAIEYNIPNKFNN